MSPENLLRRGVSSAARRLARSQARLAAVLLVLAALGPPGAAQGELVDASFEEGDGLSDAWAPEILARNGAAGDESRLALVRDVVHDGERALRLSGGSGTTSWLGVIQHGLAVEPGRRYQLAAWMATDGVRREGNQYLNCNVFVRFEDERGATIPTASGYPVVGTRPLLGTCAWTRVTTTVTAPGQARTASVGCLLSCTGQAWFDALELRPVTEPAWNRAQTDRYVLHWEGDEAPRAEAVAANTAHLERLEAFLGVRLEQPIEYFKYAGNERKAELTGNGGNAHVEGERAIHSIFWSDRHEVVHLLTRRWGTGTGLLGEGIAVHLSGGWQGRAVDDCARELAAAGELLPLEALVATSRFRSHLERVTYPEAGSWVGYLLARGGVQRFETLYRRVPLDPDARAFDALLREVYGSGLAELEAGWRTALGLDP